MTPGKREIPAKKANMRVLLGRAFIVPMSEWVAETTGELARRLLQLADGKSGRLKRALHWLAEPFARASQVVQAGLPPRGGKP
jgi:hypothetical protein